MASLTSPLTGEEMASAVSTALRVRARFRTIKDREEESWRRSDPKINDTMTDAQLREWANEMANLAAEADLLWEWATAAGIEMQYSYYEQLSSSCITEAARWMTDLMKRELRARVAVFLAGHVPADFDGQTNTWSANKTGGTLQ